MPHFETLAKMGFWSTIYWSLCNMRIMMKVHNSLSDLTYRNIAYTLTFCYLLITFFFLPWFTNMCVIKINELSLRYWLPRRSLDRNLVKLSGIHCYIVTLLFNISTYLSELATFSRYFSFLFSSFLTSVLLTRQK